VGIDQGSAESLARMKAVAAPNPIPFLALGPAFNRLLAQVDGSGVSPRTLDLVRRLKTKVPPETHRSSEALREAGIKARLIALWHRSLTPVETSRRWPLFSKTNKWQRKTIGFTAAAGH
jgi:hypothetical protein